MSKWVTESMEELLHKINDVPYTDNREGEQLTILMNGVAMINNKAMDNAAIKTRETMRKWDIESAEASLNKESVFEDNEVDELTRLRPIR